MRTQRHRIGISLVYQFKAVNWLHWTTVIVVFGITGSLSLVFSRLILTDLLKLDGSLLTGPWSYRLTYLLLIPPFYSTMLVLVGTLFGKHTYFKKRVIRMWSRVIPKRVHRHTRRY